MEQYEIRMTEEQKARFIAVAKARMKERGITARQLAKKTGYKQSSVYQFFSDIRIQNRFLAAKIAYILDIRREDWR